jgi:hypothetical protein
MNTITIELTKTDRKLLEDLTGAVTLLASVLGSMQPAETRQQIIQEATGSDHPIDASVAHLELPEITKRDLEQMDAVSEAFQNAVAAATPVIEDPTLEVKPVSFAEFQKAVTQAVAKGPGQKAAAKKIVNKYAKSVSEVPEDKRAEVMAELAKI